MKVRYVAVVALAIGASLYGDEPKVYKPTELQSLKLQVKYKDAQLAQVAMQNAQLHFSSAMAELSAEADKVKAENKWDSKVQFDPNTLIFSEPKEEVKK